MVRMMSNQFNFKEQLDRQLAELKLGIDDQFYTLYRDLGLNGKHFEDLAEIWLGTEKLINFLCENIFLNTKTDKYTIKKEAQIEALERHFYNKFDKEIHNMLERIYLKAYVEAAFVKKMIEANDLDAALSTLCQAYKSLGFTISYRDEAYSREIKKFHESKEKSKFAKNKNKKFEDLRQEVINTWLKPNPKTGKGWHTYTECANYLFSTDVEKFKPRTVCEYISKYEKEKKAHRKNTVC